MPRGRKLSENDEPPPGGWPNRVRDLRVKRGLTMEQLATLVGCSVPQINKLQRGERNKGVKLTQEWMERLAPWLDCHPCELLLNPPEIIGESEKPIVYGYRQLADKDRRKAQRFIDQLISKSSEPIEVKSRPEPRKARPARARPPRAKPPAGPAGRPKPVAKKGRK